LRGLFANALNLFFGCGACPNLEVLRYLCSLNSPS
jgi:hypothetical protein